MDTKTRPMGLDALASGSDAKTDLPLRIRLASGRRPDTGGLGVVRD
jgi:hypothetical protein